MQKTVVDLLDNDESNVVDAILSTGVPKGQRSGKREKQENKIHCPFVVYFYTMESHRELPFTTA